MTRTSSIEIHERGLIYIASEEFVRGCVARMTLPPSEEEIKQATEKVAQTVIRVRQPLWKAKRTA